MSVSQVLLPLKHTKVIWILFDFSLLSSPSPPPTSCYLQNLKLPGVLVFVVQTVSGIEIELPGRLVLVI